MVRLSIVYSMRLWHRCFWSRRLFMVDFSALKPLQEKRLTRGWLVYTTWYMILNTNKKNKKQQGLSWRHKNHAFVCTSYRMDLGTDYRSLCTTTVPLVLFGPLAQHGRLWLNVFTYATIVVCNNSSCFYFAAQTKKSVFWPKRGRAHFSSFQQARADNACQVWQGTRAYDNRGSTFLLKKMFLTAGALLNPTILHQSVFVFQLFFVFVTRVPCDFSSGYCKAYVFFL